MLINFGEWRPDSPPLSSGAREAKNVIAESDHYRPFNSLRVSTDPLTNRCHGALAVTNRTGTNEIFAGDSSKLYKLSSNSFSNVSRAAGYSSINDNNWQLLQFQKYVIATNGVDPLQSWNLESSTSFVDVTGSPPKARVMGIVGRFLVLGDLTNDTDLGTTNLGIRWSSIDNPLGSWANSATTQAGAQELKDGGAIQAIIGFDNYGIIIQERAIRRMTYVGGDVIFTFDKIQSDRGSPLMYSINSYGNNIFYIGDDGFKMMNSQGGIVSIGESKVDRYFWENFDNNYRFRVSSAIHKEHNLALWAFPDRNANNGQPNKIIAYNWHSGKWSLIEQEVDVLFNALTLSYTLEQLDVFGTLDQLPFSLDSRAWTQSKSFAGAFDASHKMGFFDGAAMPAEIESGEFQISQGLRGEITQLTSIVNGNGGTNTSYCIGVRDSKTADVSYSAPFVPNQSGKVHLRRSGMFHRIKVKISGGFDQAHGVFLDKFNVGGDR